MKGSDFSSIDEVLLNKTKKGIAKRASFFPEKPASYQATPCKLVVLGTKIKPHMSLSAS